MFISNTSRSNLTHNASSFSASSSMSRKKLKSQSQHVSPFLLNSHNASAFVQTIANTGSAFNLKDKAENHQLFCSKHSARIVDRICLHATCESEILICDECALTPEGRSHIQKHTESIFAYTDFISLCKSNSCQHSDTLASQKSFNLIVGDLDQKVLKYKEHIRREEDKIDLEFDGLITKVVADINALRTNLKQQLNAHCTTYASLCNTLRSHTSTINKEATSNFNLQNEFDTFLNNLTSQKNSACNFKRIMTNIRPNLLKNFAIQDQSRGCLLNPTKASQQNLANVHEIQSSSSTSSFNSSQQQDPASSKGVAAAAHSTSMFSSSTYSSSSSNANNNNNNSCQLVTSEKSVNRFESQLKQAFAEFQNMTTFKPLYKNEGEANSVFRQYLADSRKSYFMLLESLPKFISIATNPAATANGQLVVLSENSTTTQQQQQQQQQSYNSIPQVMMHNTSIMNSQASIQFNQSTMSSPLSKQSLFSQTLKPNVIATSFTPFNNVYSRQTTATADAMMEQQSTTTSMTTTPFAWNASQNVRLVEGQKFTTFDHLRSVQTKHKSGIFAAVLLNSIDNSFVTAGSDKCVRVYNSEFTELGCVQLETPVSSLAVLNSTSSEQMSSNQQQSTYIIAGLVQSFAVIRASDFTVVKTVDCAIHGGPVSKIVALADGQTVVTISTADSKVVAWNLFNADIMQPKKYFEHREGLQCLEQFPNRRYVATAGKDRAIKIWKLHFYNNFRMNALEKMSVSQTLESAHAAGDITALRGSASYENILMSGTSNGEIKIWDLVAGKAIQSIRDPSGWVFNIIALERPHLANAAAIHANKKPIVDSWKENNNSIAAAVTGSTYQDENAFNSPTRRVLQNGNMKTSGKKELLMGSPVQQKASQNMVFHSAGKTIDLWLSPSKQSLAKKSVAASKGLTKQQQEQLANLSIVTSTFDGMIKLWDVSSGSEGVQSPVCSTASKNVFECYPFGGVAAYQFDQQIRIITSGNSKDDHSINLWTLN